MSKSLIWAVDFGNQKITALAAQARSGGALSLVGSAEVPTQGLAAGEFIHVGDVTECLVEVLRAAEKSCGSKCQSVFFNFDDVFLESRFPIGSKTLAGEGQIRASDVEQAVASARRFVGNFEKSAVYSGRIHFLIDGKDSVVNPIGVFGRQLEVGLHVLMARAERLETWQKVMDRARLKNGTPVLSIFSCVHGVLDVHEWGGKRVVCDLGSDVLTATILENGVLQNYSGCLSQGMGSKDVSDWVAALCQKFEDRYGVFEDIVITGDLADQGPLPSKARLGAPSGLPPFDRPEHAAAVGLLRVGAEMRWIGSSNRSQKNRMDGLRQKAVSLINEYF